MDGINIERCTRELQRTSYKDHAIRYLSSLRRL